MPETLRVLYVDDEPALLEMAKLYLEMNGAFSVYTLTSAKIALDQLSTEHYDAIISDYQMPETDGIAFLKQLKASGNTTPFIIFTGKGREEVVIEALNEGADFYLQKGGEPKAQFTELANKIRYAVSRKRAEMDLRESEERYRHVVEDQTEFICRFLPDGTHIFVNEAYCRYFGLKREEIIGTRFHPTIHPDDRVTVTRLIASLKSEHPLETLDQRIIMPDGSLRWQRWVDHAIFHADGSLKEYQSVGRDITDYKCAEEALKESENTLNAVIRGSPIPQFVLDKNHRVIHWNHALEEYSGISANEVIGTDQHWRAFYPEKRPCMADLLVEGQIEKIKQWYSGKFTKSRFVTGAYEATDFFPKIRGGTWLYFTAAPIKDLNGVMIGVIETLEDITDRKRAEDALRESEIRFREQHQNNPLAIFTWQHRAGDFVLIGINKAAETLTSGRARDYLGKFASDLYSSRPEILSELRQSFSERAMISSDLISEHFLPGRFIQTTATFAPPDMIMVHMEDVTERKQAKEALIKSQSQLAEAMDLAHMANWEFDVATGLFTFDDRFYALYATTGLAEGGNQMPADVYAKKFLHPDDQYLVANEVRKAIQATDPGYISEVEHRIIRKDGEIRNIVVRFGITKDKNGVTIKTHGANQDITERKQVEKLLRESENTFTSIFHGSPVALTLVSTINGKFVNVNDAFVRATGYSREEAIGTTAEVLGIFADNHEREQLAASLRDHHIVEDMEINCRIKSGEIHPCLFSSGIILIGGKPHILSTVRDITVRKQVENALKESEEKFRGIFNAVNDGLHIHTIELDGKPGKFIEVNEAACRMLGYSREEMLKQGPLDFVTGYHSRPVDEIIMELFSTGHSVFETEHLKKDGTILPVEINARIVHLHRERVIVSVIRDISRRKELEKEMEFHEQELLQFSKSLAAANKKLNLLGSITRHDITNQLMVLMGNIGIIQKKQPDAKNDIYLQKVSAAALRISAMIQFTKEYQQIGVHAPEWQDCRKTVDTAAKEAPLGKIAVKNEITTGTTVLADPLIIKVFYNLMDNAIRYGGKITTIRFFIEAHGDDQVIVCEDDGNGIAAEEKEKIFERGFGKNTGLGLALSREILSITGITIKETGEPGKGARFEMVVPKGMYR
ncbi:MAG: PAS domain S-box protein [Methanomicrobiales archaeon]